MNSLPSRGTNRDGFSVLEILAAAAVFILLLSLLLQLTSSVHETTNHQLRRMDSISSARSALDTLSQDIGTLVTRGGATILFKKGDARTSDELKFLCISRPVSDHPDTRLSVVAYSLAQRHNSALGRSHPMLVRGYAPVFWASDASANDYVFKDLLREKDMVASDVAAERVFRFEIVWLRKDGQISRDPRGLLSAQENPNIDLDSHGYVWVDLDEVSGFIVSVAMLDGTILKRLDDFGMIQDSFPSLQNTPEHASKISASEWMTNIASAQPEHARKNVRIIQRTYFLPN